MSLRLNHHHKAIMVNFMEKHRNMIGRPAYEDMREVNNLWDSLAVLLNEVPGTMRRPASSWRKAWGECLSRLKKRARCSIGPGFSPIEGRMLSLAGYEIIIGLVDKETEGECIANVPTKVLTPAQINACSSGSPCPKLAMTENSKNEVIARRLYNNDKKKECCENSPKKLLKPMQVRVKCAPNPKLEISENIRTEVLTEQEKESFLDLSTSVCQVVPAQVNANSSRSSRQKVATTENNIEPEVSSRHIMNNHGKEPPHSAEDVPDLILLRNLQQLTNNISEESNLLTAEERQFKSLANLLFVSLMNNKSQIKQRKLQRDILSSICESLSDD